MERVGHPSSHGTTQGVLIMLSAALGDFHHQQWWFVTFTVSSGGSYSKKYSLFQDWTFTIGTIASINSILF